jgi:hypothetical protein
VWLPVNEPNTPYQDNLEPHVYAEAYHDLYHAIKAADPTARIANGGIVQVTPARLLYLGMVLDGYAERYGQAMPVDVWNIHVYVLQERSCDYDPASISGCAPRSATMGIPLTNTAWCSSGRGGACRCRQVKPTC